MVSRDRWEGGIEGNRKRKGDERGEIKGKGTRNGTRRGNGNGRDKEGKGKGMDKMTMRIKDGRQMGKQGKKGEMEEKRGR